MAGPEFSRMIEVERLKTGEPRPMSVSASGEECEALAARFGLLSLGQLQAELELLPSRRGEVRVTGTLKAALEQACVVSLEPVAAVLDLPVALRFVPEGPAASATSGREFDGDQLAHEEDEDLESYDGGAFDLGEALAQTLFMNLPLYPRSLEAGSADKEWPPEGGAQSPDTGKVHPFAGLAALKGKPKNGEN